MFTSYETKQKTLPTKVVQEVGCLYYFGGFFYVKNYEQNEN